MPFADVVGDVVANSGRIVADDEAWVQGQDQYISSPNTTYASGC